MPRTAVATNAVPAYDPTDNPTNCYPRFKPDPWDGQELHFENKPFVRASTISLFHVPLHGLGVRAHMERHQGRACGRWWFPSFEP
jgi:hydrolase family protein